MTNWQYIDPDVLRNTTGGYPHVTFFYSGKELEGIELARLGSMAFHLLADSDAHELTLEPEDAQLNSFFHERQGKQRHDVLLYLSEHDKETIEQLRSYCVPKKIANMVTMGRPHVTHSIHWSESEAQAALEEVKKHLPLKVSVVGYTID